MRTRKKLIALALALAAVSALIAFELRDHGDEPSYNGHPQNIAASVAAYYGFTRNYAANAFSVAKLVLFDKPTPCRTEKARSELLLGHNLVYEFDGQTNSMSR